MATQLKDLVNTLFERTNQQNTSFIDQSEAISYLNNSLAELWDYATTTYEDYFSDTFYCTLPNGAGGSNQNAIPVPSDCNKVRQVEFQYLSGPNGADNFYPINQFQMPQRNRYGNTPINLFLPYTLAQVTWRAMGDEILIEPVASCNGTFRVWYIPKFQNLVNLTDYLPQSIDTNAWCEYAITDSCIKIFAKNNMDASTFMQMKADIKDRIKSSMSNRTVGSPKVMINARRRGRGGFGNNNFGPGSVF